MLTLYTVTCATTSHRIHATGAAQAIAKAMALFGHTRRISAHKASA